MSRFPLALGVVLSAGAVACGGAPDGPTAPTATLSAPLDPGTRFEHLNSLAGLPWPELTAVVGVDRASSRDAHSGSRRQLQRAD
jgi:hypothetical protein